MTSQLLIILTGPSGSGKSTMLDLLEERKPFRFHRFVTCTTRAKRPGERHGREYWFLSRQEFERDIQHDYFFEWADVYGNYYGSSKKEIQRLSRRKAPIIMILDVQGMKTIKTQYPNTFSIFLDATQNSLIHRLKDRGTEPKELERRMNKIKTEERLRSLADKVIMNADGKKNQTYRAVVAAIKLALSQDARLSRPVGRRRFVRQKSQNHVVE